MSATNPQPSATPELPTSAAPAKPQGGIETIVGTVLALVFVIGIGLVVVETVGSVANSLDSIVFGESEPEPLSVRQPRAVPGHPVYRPGVAYPQRPTGRTNLCHSPGARQAVAHEELMTIQGRIFNDRYAGTYSLEPGQNYSSSNYTFKGNTAGRGLYDGGSSSSGGDSSPMSSGWLPVGH